MGEATWTTSRAALGLVMSVAVALLVQAWSVSPAGAHAVLLETAPEADEVVGVAPAEVELVFDEPMQLPVTIEVTGPDGDDESVTDGDATIDGEVVRVDLDSVAHDGVYAVTWRAVSADDHPVEGEFAFEVSEAAGEEATEEPDRGDQLEATAEPERTDELEATEEPERGGQPEGEATEDPAEEGPGQIDATEPAVAVGGGGVDVLPLLLVAAVLVAVLATGAAVWRQRRQSKTGSAHMAPRDEMADRT